MQIKNPKFEISAVSPKQYPNNRTSSNSFSTENPMLGSHRLLMQC